MRAAPSTATLAHQSSESKGHRFDSCRVHHLFLKCVMIDLKLRHGGLTKCPNRHSR